MEKFHLEAFPVEEDCDQDSWSTSAGELELSKAKEGQSGMKRLVMIQRTEQRTYLTTEQGKDPQLETTTRQTIETFSGGRRVTTQDRKHVQPKPEDSKLFDAALTMQKLALGLPKEEPAPTEPEKKAEEPVIPTEVVEEKPEPEPEPEPKPAPEPEKKKVSEDQDDLDQFNKFQIECLRRHNELRARHGSPRMKLDRALCDFATGWAQRCANMNALQHSTTHSENIAMAHGMDVTGATPVNMWYDEIKLHNYFRAH